MKNLFILTLFIQVFNLNLFCQDDKKLEYSLDYSVGQSYRTIETPEDFHYFNDQQIPALMQGIDFRVKYKLTNKLGLITGLGYQQYGDQLKLEMNLTFGDQIDPRHGFIYTVIDQPQPHEIRLKHIYSYLELPILVNYLVLDKEKNKLDISLGGNINYFLSAKTKTLKKYDERKNERSSSKTVFSNSDFNFGGQIAVSYRRMINKKLFVKVGPRFDYFFTSISKDVPVKYFPYKTSVVLAVGF